MERVSRMEAARAGKTRFFTGNICIRGHLDERLTSNGQCIVCIRDKVKQRAKSASKLLQLNKIVE